MPAAIPMSTILVTGASGFVGRHTLPRLLDAGHRVVAFVRSEAAAVVTLDGVAAQVRERVTTRIGDVTRIETVRAAADGADAILHLVAIPRDDTRGAELRLVNTEGTRNVLVVARDAGIRRFIHQGALGISDDPAFHYASSKARAERLVADSGLAWTIVKPSLIWGPGDGFFNLIAELVRVSPVVLPVPAGARSRFQPISVRDVARCLAACFRDDRTVGSVVELGGPRQMTYSEIVREVMAAMGSRRLLLPVPVPLIRLVAGAAELLRLPFPIATDQLAQMALDNITALDAVSRTFGFQPADLSGQLGYLRQRPREQERAA
ncbi:MAG TPA: complex I NDUFA9 subunit family protein [Candidatus Limnocylindrales bacterium]